MATFMFGRGDDAVNSGPTAITAAGTAAATATALTGLINNVTTAASETGVTLPLNQAQGSPVIISNVGTTTVAITVYPPTTAGVINGTASYSVAADKAVVCFPHPNGIDYTVIGA